MRFTGCQRRDGPLSGVVVKYDNNGEKVGRVVQWWRFCLSDSDIGIPDNTDVFWISARVLANPEILIGKRIKFVDITSTIYCTVVVEDDISETTNGEKKMNGKLYKGVVTNTKKVPAGEGVTAAVDKTEIVHETGYFVAFSDDLARAQTLAEASQKAKLNLSDPTNQIEVHLK